LEKDSKKSGWYPLANDKRVVVLVLIGEGFKVLVAGGVIGGFTAS